MPSPLPPKLPATLEISKFVVRGLPTTPGHAVYSVTLQVKETSGLGGADLATITITDSKGNSDVGCGGRVEPGRTWDMDVKSSGYCIPGVPSITEVATVSVAIEFVTDDGTRGELTRTVDTTR